MLERTAQQLDQARSALHPPAHVEEAPAGPACHALGAQSGKRRQVEDQRVEQGNQIGSRREDRRPSARPHPWPRKAVPPHPGENFPGIDRDPIPHHRRHLPHAANGGVDARRPRLFKDQCPDLRRDFRRRLPPARFQPLRPRERRISHRSQEQGHRCRSLQIALRGHPHRYRAQQPRRPFGPFDVASEPVQMIGHTTGEIVAAAPQRKRLPGRGQERDRRDRARGEHPHILRSLPRQQRLLAAGTPD